MTSCDAHIWHHRCCENRLIPFNQKEYMVVNFIPEHKAILDEMLLGHPAIRPGKMFGYPADIRLYSKNPSLTC